MIKGTLVRKLDSKSFELEFRTVPELFSYKHIDDGTLLLLDQLEVNESDNCLDLGCGYGVIGIAMAKLAPKGKTCLVDRDFVAVEYSNINIRENNATNAKAILSNGFSHLAGARFDLVASNLPTHVGQLSLKNIIKEMGEHLNKEGRAYVVTVSILNPFIKREFLSVFGNYEKLKTGKKHTVSLAVRE